MKRIVKKLGLIFIIMGMCYLNIEIVIRAIFCDLVGHSGLSVWSLAGWTSLWMFPVGGIIGVALGLLNEIPWLKKNVVMMVQCIIGLLIILTIELSTGIVLNLWLKLHIWDYSQIRFNLLGQICLSFSVIWFMLCPFAFWLDDYMRYKLYGEDTYYSILTPYKKLFTLR